MTHIRHILMTFARQYVLKLSVLQTVLVCPKSAYAQGRQPQLPSPH